MFQKGQETAMLPYDRPDLAMLAERRDGFRVSIYMPTHPAGAEVQQGPIRLGNLLDRALDELVGQGMRRPDAEELLAPARRLEESFAFWQHQSEGLAIFASGDGIHLYRVPLAFESVVVVGEAYHIKPLLPLMSGDGRFYVLALSQGETRLLHGTRHSVSELEAKEIPDSLAEALALDDPEARLQWHTGTGGKGNAASPRPAVFHGHGVASADDAKDNILRYAHKINDGVTELLADEKAPLVLAGVEYVVSIYKEANRYPHLVDEAVLGNPEELTAEELHRRAWDMVAPRFERAKAEAAAEYERLSGQRSERASDDLVEVVLAVQNGRVDTLFVAVDQERWGSVDVANQRVTLDEERQTGDQDLLDVAATHTLINSGTVYAVSRDLVPGGGCVAAIFRYP
jgi:hypothetical protein